MINTIGVSQYQLSGMQSRDFFVFDDVSKGNEYLILLESIMNWWATVQSENPDANFDISSIVFVSYPDEGDHHATVTYEVDKE